MIWYALMTFVFLLVGAVATFNDAARQSRVYVPLMVTVSMFNAAIFGLAAQALNNKEKVLVLSLVLDALMVFTYYALPILFMGVRPPPSVLLGAALIVAGFAFIKFGV